MLINGTLTKITDFKALIVQISKDTFDTIRNTKVDEKISWEYEFELPLEDGEEESGFETRYYCKINLNRFDKAIVEKKFNGLVKKDVTATVVIDGFTPKASDDNPEPTPVTFFILKKMSEAKQVKMVNAKEPVVDLQKQVPRRRTGTI